MKSLIITLLLPLTLLIACQKTAQVTDIKDLEKYLSSNENIALEKNNEQIEFWLSKENENSTTVYQTQLAGLYSAKYKLSGDVSYLHQADELLELVNNYHKETNPGILRMLASNSISQHKFKEAYSYASKAIQYKNNLYASNLVLFDACMELGYFIQAEGILNDLDDKNSFDYKVRLSKWKDHVGDLPQAIAIMESALEGVSPNNTSLKIWTISNLADMYGHAGEVKKSYDAYVQVLELDNSYYYALKGIAYIAYAHDENTTAAKQILNYLDKNHPVPDYKLLLAEIAEFENDTKSQIKYLNEFYAEVSLPQYGNMYNKYIMDIDLQRENYDKAIEMAEQEVQNRATPQTYDLLAWTYLQAGFTEKALQITEEFVVDKTFEPDASYHMGVLYSNINKDMALKHLNEAKDAAFELGPITSKEINTVLSEI